MFLPDMLPMGDPVQMYAFPIDGEPISDVGVWWVNPNSGRLIFHHTGVSRSDIEYSG
jgi:hypothetical protein